MTHSDVTAKKNETGAWGSARGLATLGDQLDNWVSVASLR